jgi:hypothetical protein
LPFLGRSWPWGTAFWQKGYAVRAQIGREQARSDAGPSRKRRCAGALGKKNWLFFGSEEAGQRSAVIYTLIENCRLHGVEPYTYLKDVLERLPRTTNREVDQLTPLKWKQARQSALKQAA